MGTGAGQSAAAGQGAQDTGKWDAAGEPLLEKCIDLRAEYPAGREHSSHTRAHTHVRTGFTIKNNIKMSNIKELD